MGYFPVRYNSRVVIYERKIFIRLATESCGCGSVGRAVASDTCDLRFKNGHHQTIPIAGNGKSNLRSLWHI